MVRISIFYPNKDGGHFDTSYYLETHMPMAIGSFGAACRGVWVETGINGGLPDSPAPYAVMCHFLFDSADDFYAAFLPHAEKLQGDIPNYTNLEPVIQISEVRLCQ